MKKACWLWVGPFPISLTFHWLQLLQGTVVVTEAGSVCSPACQSFSAVPAASCEILVMLQTQISF